MKISKIKEILEKLKYEITEVNDEKICFLLFNNICTITNEGKIYVPQENYGIVPHVMKDGAVCLYGNESIEIQDSIDVEMHVDGCLKWLLALSPNMKTAEFLNELEFFVIHYLQKKIKISSVIPDTFNEKVVHTPNDLWEFLYEITANVWYKITIAELDDFYAYCRYDSKLKTYLINHDTCHRAAQRVLGPGYERINGKFTLIGVGSVGSYIFKQLVCRGVNEFVLVDDQNVEVSNIFRYAFPYVSINKCKAAEKFAKKYDRSISIKSIISRINSDTQKIPEIMSSDYIIISVDNLKSWIDVYKHIFGSAREGCIVILVGIDAFGRFGKYVKFRVNSGISHNYLLDFMIYNRSGQRKQMVGNGCGNSIAVYSEKDILNLADLLIDSIIKEEGYNEVIDIAFES